MAVAGWLVAQGIDNVDNTIGVARPGRDWEARLANTPVVSERREKKNRLMLFVFDDWIA
jgi:hypothetical protein